MTGSQHTEVDAQYLNDLKTIIFRSFFHFYFREKYALFHCSMKFWQKNPIILNSSHKQLSVNWWYWQILEINHDSLF